jgi:hypothetical protein
MVGRDEEHAAKVARQIEAFSRELNGQLRDELRKFEERLEADVYRDVGEHIRRAEERFRGQRAAMERMLACLRNECMMPDGNFDVRRYLGLEQRLNELLVAPRHDLTPPLRLLLDDVTRFQLGPLTRYNLRTLLRMLEANGRFVDHASRRLVQGIITQIAEDLPRPPGELGAATGQGSAGAAAPP